jgi:hypothetical protein
MMTDTELRLEGFKALVKTLGEVQAERFIALTLREPFDYTHWQRTLWPTESIAALSHAAMQARQKQPEQPLHQL